MALLRGLLLHLELRGGGHAERQVGGWGGGTSLASPLWAALAALVDSGCAPGGRLGFLDPALYSLAADHDGDFHDITVGNNDITGTNGGKYPATPGYDMASGLGTPNATQLESDLCWTPAATQPQAETGAAPALAYYKGDLYAAWRGVGANEDVFYSADNGVRWSPQEKVSGAWGSALTSNPPALAVYDGNLYAAWTDATGSEIWYSAFNGSSWSDEATVSGSSWSALTDRGPALGVFHGKLYAAWTGPPKDLIWFSGFDGSSWGTQTSINETTSDAPALIGDPANGFLLVAWTTAAHKLDYTFQGGPVPEKTLPGASTNDSPALAVIDFTVYVAWTARSTDRIGYESSFDNGRFSREEFEPQARSRLRPGLASNAGTLYVAWLGKSVATLSYAWVVHPY